MPGTGKPGHTVDTDNSNAKQESKDCLSLSIKVPKDTKSLATFKSFLCFLLGVGETACLVGKTIAQGQSTGYIHQRDGWDRTDFSFRIGMTHELVYSKSSILHGERWVIGGGMIISSLSLYRSAPSSSRHLYVSYAPHQYPEGGQYVLIFLPARPIMNKANDTTTLFVYS